MIEKLLPFQFIKKSPFYGSYQGMNYRIVGKSDNLEVCVFPGPYNMQHTPEKYWEIKTFVFSEEGYEEAIAWLNEKFQEKDWKEAQLP